MNIKNYNLINKKSIPELNSVGYLLEHDKTKAQVLYLKNDNDIKTFSISFKTPPDDSKGVAHILEHSVLSGSRKFKTKEPFMDMINSSMQTFLNAMTFSDKTMYPVASKNDKDFFNLMDVYLDSVFFPAIYTDENIFKQEGIHLELEELAGDITYNGVVYNEMRGALADPESQVLRMLPEHLHPNSTYAHESGGDPYEIVDLSYQELLDFHKRYYHPSNSYIFLNGDIDIESILTFIDEEYLSQFDYQDPKSEIITGDRFDNLKVSTDYYSVGEGDDTTDKNYLAYGVDLGDSTSIIDGILTSVLVDVLLASDSSILKTKLLQSGIAEDYYPYTSTSLPLDLYFIAKNAKSDKLEEYVELIDKTLREAVQKGLDEELITATLNKLEFGIRDMGTEAGLHMSILAMNSWLYDEDPLEGLSFKDSLDFIRENISTGYIEDFIEERILNNPQKIHFEAQPKPGLNKEKDQKLKSDLENLKDTLSDEELEKLIQETQDLFEYQLSPDTPEDKATIPTLEIEDIDRDITTLDTKIDTTNYLKIHVDEHTNGIFYMLTGYNLKNLTYDQLGYAGLLFNLLGSMDTKNFSYQELATQMGIYTGGISFRENIVSNSKDDTYTVWAGASLRTLDMNIDKGLEILREIILHTDLSDLDRIRELVMIEFTRYQSNMEYAGHSNIVQTLQAKKRIHSNYKYQLSGNGYYFFLKDLIENWDDKRDTLVDQLQDVYQLMFNDDNYLSATTDRKGYQKAVDFMETLRPELSKYNEKLEEPELDQSTIALENSSTVVYVGELRDLKDLDVEYEAPMTVMARIISGQYLHQNIRAKGGAYGSGIGISRDGLISMFSYRDPNLDLTYDVYEGIGEFIQNLDLTDRELTDYIISTMNTFDPPLAPSNYSGIALARHLADTTKGEIRQLKAEAIDTTIEDITEFVEYWDKLEPIKGVLGSKDLIENSKIKFEEKLEIL